jgi:hypothetical protein
MRVVILVAVLISALPSAATASADPGAVAAAAEAPPFVDHVSWARWTQGAARSSLRVYPTASGRAAARQLGSSSLAAEEAWHEVLAQAPQADTPGMRDQFRCHWDFAEVAQPGKTSWNLEPWRPVVDDVTMVNSGCNPGGGPEPS